MLHVEARDMLFVMGKLDFPNDIVVVILCICV